MKGDFTRNTFNKQKHFSRVLMQQGRVQLDADWNEQTAILLHYLRTLATDLIGPHGGPKDTGGFEIIEAGKLDQATRTALKESSLPSLKDDDLLITPGRYYVGGLLCENNDYVLFTDQHDWTHDWTSGVIDTSQSYIFYLDVWERLITYIEDDEIREVALNGPDTAVRSQLVWQVKTQKVDEGTTCNDEMWGSLVEEWQPENRGMLKAQARVSEVLDGLDPCTTSPDARYRGAENQLYRVEIHRGSPKNGEKVTEDNAATFKWSRENGTVTFPIQTINGEIVTVENLGRDGRFSLQKNDWVEIVDDDTVLGGLAEQLLKVVDVNPMTREVTLDSEPTKVSDDESKHPLLRRWDHKTGDADQHGLTLHEGAALIEEGIDESGWLLLEDGIQTQFQALDGEEKSVYRTGDYWLIPARTITGDIEWPKENNGVVPPHGVEHHYAPLAIVMKADTAPVDCRHQFESLAKLLEDTT